MQNFVPYRFRFQPTNNVGFSLIEILISILVLSFGVLGAIKMQLFSIQASIQSNFHSTAMELASDMADRMRGNGDRANFFHSVRFQSNAETPSSVDTCYLTHCSSAQLAKADIAEWLQQVDAALPNARAVICRDSSPWNSATNNLTWDCSPDDNASIIIKLGWAAPNEDQKYPAPRLAVAVTPYLN